MSRLITFGCSHTAGTSLRTEDTWSYKLANLLGRELCNQGVEGNSIKGISWNVSKFDFLPDDYVVILWTIQNRWTIIDDEPGYIFPQRPDKTWYDKYHSVLDDTFTSEAFIKYTDSFLTDRDVEALHVFSHPMFHSSGLLNASQYCSELKLKNSYSGLHFYEDFKKYPKASDNLHLGKEANSVFCNQIYKHILKVPKPFI